MGYHADKQTDRQHIVRKTLPPRLSSVWAKNGVETVTLITIGCVRYSGLRTGNTYGPGSGIIWLKDVYCDGDEYALEQCNHSPWGVTSSCDHDDDVAITCSTSLQNTIGK